MGLVTSSAGGSETRPAGQILCTKNWPVCQELAARVADGVTSVGAAMKRGTGLSQRREVLARAAVERRKASASAQSGARRDCAIQAALRLCATAVSTPAPFGAPPPLICLEAPFRTVPYSSGAGSRRENDEVCVVASQRTRAKSRGPMTGSAKQSRAACVSREAALDCFVAIAPRNDECLFTSPRVL